MDELEEDSATPAPEPAIAEPCAHGDAPLATLAETTHDLFLQCLTAGSLTSRDLGRLRCTARWFSHGIVEAAACRILMAAARTEAQERVEFESMIEPEQLKTLETAQCKASDWGFSFPPSHETVTRFWGDGQPSDSEIAWLGERQVEIQQTVVDAKARWEKTRARLAGAVATAEQEPLKRLATDRQRDERWLQMLRRRERPLAFTDLSQMHDIAVQAGGRVVARGLRERLAGRHGSTSDYKSATWQDCMSESGYNSAVCAEHRMTAGVHRAEFALEGEESDVAVGIVQEVYGRPANTQSGWRFSSRGFSVQHDSHEFPGAEAFGPGDTIRLELDLSGEWGGHVVAREGNRIRTAPRLGPATRALLRAFKNGEYLGEVASFQKDPETAFYWLVEMTGPETLTWLEISRPDARREFGFGVQRDQVTWANPHRFVGR